MPRRCGNRWQAPPSSSVALHNQTRHIAMWQQSRDIINTIRSSSLNLEIHKACCCDDRCESVDSLGTPAMHLTYGTALRVANCENLGKRSACRAAHYEIPKLVHALQHIFPTFYKSSPQHTNTHSNLKMIGSKVVERRKREARVAAFQR